MSEEGTGGGFGVMPSRPKKKQKTKRKGAAMQAGQPPTGLVQTLLPPVFFLFPTVFSFLQLAQRLPRFRGRSGQAAAWPSLSDKRLWSWPCRASECPNRCELPAAAALAAHAAAGPAESTCS